MRDTLVYSDGHRIPGRLVSRADGVMNIARRSWIRDCRITGDLEY